MFFTQFLAALAASAAVVTACAPELYKRGGHHPAHIKRHLSELSKRANRPSPIEDHRGWTFDQSEEWNTLHADWSMCFSGTQQAPIALQTSWGYSQNHRPTFNYNVNLTGALTNWDFGPYWILDDRLSHRSLQGGGDGHRRREEETSPVPHIVFEEDGKPEAVYLRSWHTHAPAEHTIDGYRPKAELHLVHYDEHGNPRAVIAVFIDRKPDAAPSPFFNQLPGFTSIFENRTISGVHVDMNQAINECGEYKNFFTYKGSLTTPPCSEGLRWFVAGDILYISDEQMQKLLSVSTFSARPTWSVWEHAVNE